MIPAQLDTQYINCLDRIQTLQSQARWEHRWRSTFIYTDVLTIPTLSLYRSQSHGTNTDTINSGVTSAGLTILIVMRTWSLYTIQCFILHLTRIAQYQYPYPYTLQPSIIQYIINISYYNGVHINSNIFYCNYSI